MAGIPLDVAHFMGLLAASVLYGIFLIMFSSSISPLWNRRHRGHFLLIVVISLFVFTSGHLELPIAIFITVNYDAFIKHRETLGVDAYFRAQRTLIMPLEFAVLPGTLLSAAVFACDILILWRLYIIWSCNRWIIIVPATLLFIESVLYTVLSVMGALHIKSKGTVITCGVIIDLVNIICTPLIVGRLWWVGRRTQLQETRNLYNTIVSRLIESGSLFTVTHIVYVCVFATPGLPGVSTFMTYVFTMVSAIAPMLVVLHLNSTAVSGMHVIDFDVTRTQGGGGVIPQPSMGMISTTIAFNRVPLGLDR